MNIEMQEQNPKASITTAVSELSSLGYVDQQMQATKKVEDSNMVRNQTENPMDMVAKPHSEKPITTEEIYISQKVKQLIEVPRIDFILEDKLLTIEACDLQVQSKQRMHLMVRLHIHAEVKHQMQQRVPCTSTWKTILKLRRLNQAFNPCTKTKDQVAYRKVMRLAFNRRTSTQLKIEFSPSGEFVAGQAHGLHGSTR